MSLEIWIAFVVASTVLLVVPGPTIMLSVSYALGRGRGVALAAVPGVVLGDFVAMTASLLGAGAVLAASATLFTIMKLAGAAYLIWLGIKLWRSPPQAAAPEAGQDRADRWAICRNAFVVTALNPKSIVFFVAFVPQFVDPAAAVLPQFVILEATFLALAGLSITLWIVLAGQLRQVFLRPGGLRLVNRVGGGFLIGAGALTAAVQRNA